MAENRPTPPDVDRVAASRAAVAARRARAAVKDQIAHEKRSALEVLSTAINSPDGVEGRLRVTEFLISIPAIGVTKMRRIMSQLEISPSKRLGGLGKHQRDRLRGFLSSRSRVRRGASSARLVVLAGPTAVGKGTVAGYIREHYPQVLLSVGSIESRTAIPLARQCDAAYLVVDLGRTGRQAALEALARLELGGVRVLGCVLTGAPAA